MQGEGPKLGGWRTDAESGLESTKDGCLEKEVTLAVGIKPESINWQERQVDGLEPGQLAQ